ncbi:hypothetical protein T440DRAFT_470346 [Plenodomus tracheiphilus IPT5]|uniref:Uncharacterized protein n=1 Tax=Plenodomus tracheiphilus IPT5 TaxID=1408161 RepID=A0A6A7B1K8_9PLEO|nr:hypothetical protein T440DRAFT_470346 [Plenodomus tracheiphilus IPT5]
MAFKLQQGVEYISHKDPEHDHIQSLHDYESCTSCDCAEVKELGQHCQHCYHCPPCSSAVAMGCRPCPSSPDNSIYLSYIVRRRKGDSSDDGSNDHDCEKVREGGQDGEEWSSCMEPPQSPDFYPPDSPPPLDNEEDVAGDQIEAKTNTRGTPPEQ